MRNIKVIVLSAILILAGAFQINGQNWEIVPGRSVGQIEQNTSEKGLIKIFGRENVKRMAVDVGEGESEQGTVLFPNDPRKKLFILWRDAATRERPASVLIRGKNTLWKTDRGITIGTPLSSIEQLNGRAFALTGFGWDYSGTVLHSNGGQVAELGNEAGEEITGRTLLLRLAPATALQRTPEYKAVQGDKKFLSDDRAMRKLNPRVYEIIVEFSL
jgi:hypothetical protein